MYGGMQCTMHNFAKCFVPKRIPPPHVQHTHTHTYGFSRSAAAHTRTYLQTYIHKLDVWWWCLCLDDRFVYRSCRTHLQTFDMQKHTPPHQRKCIGVKLVALYATHCSVVLFICHVRFSQLSVQKLNCTCV